MSELEIRDAIAVDRDEVLKFCRDTWDWGDYIEYVWDDWIDDPHGKMIVGLLDGVPVSVVHIGFMSDDEGWIEGMRISPQHRKKGIGSALSKYCLGEFVKAGIHIVRFMTLSSNEPIHRIGENHGYNRCGSCYVLWSELQEGHPDSLIQVSADCVDELWAYIEESDIYRAGFRLYSVGWIYQEFNKERLKHHLEMGEVYALADREPLDAFAIVVTSWLHKGPVIGYLDGKNVQSLGTLISELRLLNMDGEVTVDRRIDTNFPQLDWLKELYLKAGYKPYYDEGFFLYDLAL